VAQGPGWRLAERGGHLELHRHHRKLKDPMAWHCRQDGISKPGRGSVRTIDS
jgi:hypothetical protein